MALLMPDVNLRRKRSSFQNFWSRALSGENNDSTNSERPSHSMANVSSWRTTRRRREEEAPPQHLQPSSDNQADEEPFIPVRLRALQHDSKKNGPPSSGRSTAVIVQTAPRSRGKGAASPPKSRYVKRIQGPTLATVLDRIGRNEGDVTELDFSNLSSRNKRLEPYGGVLVARVLSVNRTVKRLIIRDHAIGDRGAVAIANMLRYNSTIEYIDLYSNDITDAGALAIAKALYGHESVEHLSMWSNAITNRGARAFADALRCNRVLKYLGLVHNRITDDGAQDLLDALEVNVHLETLNLATNRISHSITSQIRVALARNRVDAPQLVSAMRSAEEDVRKRLDEMNLGDDESVYDAEDFSEASGFLSCSDADEPDEDGVWI